MKKLIAITLAAVLGLSILSGCGEEKPVPTPTPPQTPEVVETTPPPAPIADIPEFPVTKEIIIADCNKELEDSGYTALVGEKGESKESDLMGKNTAYEYNVGPGSNLILFESDVTKNVISMFMMADKSKSDKDTMKKSGSLIAILLDGMTTGETELEKIETKLQLDKFEEGTSTYAEGEFVSFSFDIRDGVTTLLISPAST